MKKLVFVFAALLMENLPDAVSRWHCVGGSLSTRALAKLKAAPAGVQSWVAALGKDELTRNVANSKPACMVAAGLLGITIACSGCGNGDGPVTPTETEVVEVTEVTEVTDLYDGDIIYFKQAGIIYEGRVVKGVSATEVLVRLADSSEMVIGVDHIGGTQIADHPDLEVQVVMLNDLEDEKLVRFFIGKIVGVYTDGMRKLRFLIVELVDGRGGVLGVPYIRFVDEDTDFKDGGYLTKDEFARLFDR